MDEFAFGDPVPPPVDTGPYNVDPLMFITDQREAGQLAMTAPAPGDSASMSPAWERIIKFGVGRAIDNAVGRDVGIYGNTYPGSFGGMNGRTYGIRPTGAGGGTAGMSISAGADGGMGTILLIGLAALLLLR